MTKKKVIVDARADIDGDITHVKFKGNQKFTPVSIAIPIADRGEIEKTHVVHSRVAKTHLRTNRNITICNNLDTMAGNR